MVETVIGEAGCISIISPARDVAPSQEVGTMHALVLIFQPRGKICAFIAAYHWYNSAIVDMPDFEMLATYCRNPQQIRSVRRARAYGKHSRGAIEEHNIRKIRV